MTWTAIRILICTSVRQCRGSDEDLCSVAVFYINTFVCSLFPFFALFLFPPGAKDGKIYYYKNTGSVSVPSFAKQTGSANPFNNIDFGYVAAPLLFDFDGDGVMDALVGDRDGLLNYCPNAGTATSPSYSCTTSYSDTSPPGNPFRNIDIRNADKGGVVTPGHSGGDHSYTKPFAVDIVRFSNPSS